MLNIHRLSMLMLLLFTLILTACGNKDKELKEEKKVLLKGKPSDSSYYLAQDFFDKGDYSSALEFHHKQLQEDLKYYPEVSLEIALDYNNIGLDYDELKNYEKALEFYLKTMKIDEQTLEQNSTERSTTYYNVANSYFSLNQYENAIKYYLKALKIDIYALSETHEDVWAEHEKLAMSYEKIGKKQMAISYWQKSLSYQTSLYGQYSQESNETREKIDALKKSMRQKNVTSRDEKD